jgi:hypothetical protein
MARNQRLHDAIRQNGHRLGVIADAVGADPKTVERWITTGRLPRPAARRKAAEVLGVPESVLWPDAPGVAYGTSELVGIYTTRKELPPATIGSLLDAAEHQVDVLAYAALWLWDTVPELAGRLAQKVASGTRVRVCLGDPDSDAVALRGREEGDSDGMTSRCRIAANYAKAIQRADDRAVRQSRTTCTTLCSGSTTRCWSTPISGGIQRPTRRSTTTGDGAIAASPQPPCGRSSAYGRRLSRYRSDRRGR